MSIQSEKTESADIDADGRHLLKKKATLQPNKHYGIGFRFTGLSASWRSVNGKLPSQNMICSYEQGT